MYVCSKLWLEFHLEGGAPWGFCSRPSRNCQVLVAPSPTQLDAVLLNIAMKQAPYSEGGFETAIYTSSLGCHATLAAAERCPPLINDEEKLALLSAVAATLNTIPVWPRNIRTNSPDSRSMSMTLKRF